MFGHPKGAKQMKILTQIVLLLAILSLLKGLLFLLAPNLARKLIDTWVEMPGYTARFVGTVIIACGVLLTGAAVWEIGNTVIVAVIVTGTVLILSGSIYFAPGLLRALAKPFRSPGREWPLRLAGGISLIIAGAFFFCWMMARKG